MGIHYKILCEVKILHEYYLTEGKGENVFAGAGQQQRIEFLNKQFMKRVPHIGNDFECRFPESMKKKYDGYHLRIVPSYSGFKLAVGCKKELLADGSFIYIPLVNLPENLEILIVLVPKQGVAHVSQTSLTSPVRSKKYFSNDNSIGQRIFPFLSLPVPARDNSLQYEQGEVADTGPAIVMFLNNGAVDPWKVLQGQGYSSNADSLLVPFRFTYYFINDQSITEANFLLRDSNGLEINSIQKASRTSFRSVSVDFTPDSTIKIKSIPGNSVNTDIVYQLEVNASNGYSRTHRIIFVDSMLITEPAEAIINLKPLVAAPDFRLINNEGNLPLKDLMNTPRIPVFEIWLKSKSVFLRYKNDKEKKLRLSAETTGLLIDNDGVLVSEQPVNLSFQPVIYQKQDSSFQLLPNPSNDSVIVEEDGKLLTDIRVPISKIFPLR